jgi:hypothetical protein
MNADTGWQITCLVLCLVLFWAVLSHASSGDTFMTEHTSRLAAEANVTALQATVVALKPTPRPCPNTYNTGRC